MKKLFSIKSLAVLWGLSMVVSASSTIPPVSYGLNRLTDVSRLPILDRNTRVKYEGSIDKNGENADWDWHLYPDSRGEWVIFDVAGAGCIYNMVQHRYLTSEEPIFRFYFDGESEPRFTIRLSEFGEKYPFTEPQASCYIGPLDHGRGPIRVVRSFVPMPFRNGCRITSSVKLEGAQREKGEGGWGHVVYHAYTSPDGIETFTGNEDYSQLIRQWKQTGSNPDTCAMRWIRRPEQTLDSGDTLSLLQMNEGGVIHSLRLYVADMNPDRLQNLWVRLRWDSHDEADVWCPIGCFFGNSLGYNNTRYLLMGTTTDGWFYNYFPMPFWECAEVELVNRGDTPVTLAFAEVAVGANDYDRERSGYFRSSPYYARKHTPGADSRIASIKGWGKMVAAHVTCYGERPHIITCEGDVRVHIDGIRTPQVESDGSESYICYGWGFPTPAEGHPSGGYDGLSDNPWSMTRLCLGDSYPFYSSLDFGIESGEHNNQYLEHSGAIFYYGREEPVLVETDRLNLASSQSIKEHRYKARGEVEKSPLVACFEGDADDEEVAGTVWRFTEGSSFEAGIQPENRGVRLRRLSDQQQSRQCARVWVDGEEVGVWYLADSNPYKRWIEDEFEIPESFTRGKSMLHIRLEPESREEGAPLSWNEAAYVVFCYTE
ncbi:DUF2961 domain-containing protein [Barnesiella sp. An55]|uniref:DUF2961 domain-containing protein n=1 Tax=Barnesiella sp. An55 TaxID=1965646 RepID=UPI000B36DE12|nr:DUF2961 domain-containing protein [Barnesiella sp. An55]OUN71529.1 hypothetical protein B5G10_08965 [Barnesiella sp. An55]HIZ26849.1 DUF2961 domain-containing protein [Candidatus Barnesiella merdipullorum]